MKRSTLRTLATAFALGLGLTGTLVACGGDDQFVQPGGTTDGGKTDGGLTDGGKTDGGDGGGLTDGGDGGCQFTAFVLDQVTNQTKENTSPVANTGVPDPTCSLGESNTVFAPLFK